MEFHKQFIFVTLSKMIQLLNYWTYPIRRWFSEHNVLKKIQKKMHQVKIMLRSVFAVVQKINSISMPWMPG